MSEVGGIKHHYERNEDSLPHPVTGEDGSSRSLSSIAINNFVGSCFDKYDDAPEGGLFTAHTMSLIITEMGKSASTEKPAQESLRLRALKVIYIVQNLFSYLRGEGLDDQIAKTKEGLDSVEKELLDENRKVPLDVISGIVKGIEADALKHTPIPRHLQADHEEVLQRIKNLEVVVALSQIEEKIDASDLEALKILEVELKWKVVNSQAEANAILYLEDRITKRIELLEVAQDLELTFESKTPEQPQDKRGYRQWVYDGAQSVYGTVKGWSSYCSAMLWQPEKEEAQPLMASKVEETEAPPPPLQNEARLLPLAFLRSVNFHLAEPILALFPPDAKFEMVSDTPSFKIILTKEHHLIIKGSQTSIADGKEVIIPKEMTLTITTAKDMSFEPPIVVKGSFLLGTVTCGVRKIVRDSANEEQVLVDVEANIPRATGRYIYDAKKAADILQSAKSQSTQ